ncbi:MAG: sporulation integral membrane protein YtvI [Erysipelotrichaceae bacterium]|nr:sporulation integral membrane protein YtvI [Erysipelotrichaceae bacterium]
MKRKKEFIINCAYIAVIVALIYLGVRYVLDIILPFLLGFLFAYNTIRLSHKLFKADKVLYRIITLIITYVVIALIITLLVTMGINKVGDFIKAMPNFYKTTIEPYITSMEQIVEHYSDLLPDFIQNSWNDITGSVFEAVKSGLSSLASGLVNLTTNMITSAPNLLASVIIMLVTSFYFVTDYEKIANWFTGSLPDHFVEVLYEIRDFCENTLLKILVAYAQIMGITFIELSIGLTIFRVSNPIMWSLAIAFLDILPVLGVGTVLIPWAISCLIIGNVLLGIELLILYTIISFIRNIIEPKMVGTNLGLHPLATLFSMIVGLKLLGPVGMFGFPTALSFFVTREKKENE